MIENNVDEKHFRNIHGVGDMIFALKLRNSQYKNLDFVQERYRQLDSKSKSEPKSGTDFDLFNDRSAKKKAKAAHLFFGKELNQSDQENVTSVAYCLHSPYTGHLFSMASLTILNNS